MNSFEEIYLELVNLKSAEISFTIQLLHIEMNVELKKICKAGIPTHVLVLIAYLSCKSIFLLVNRKEII